MFSLYIVYVRKNNNNQTFCSQYLHIYFQFIGQIGWKMLAFQKIKYNLLRLGKLRVRQIFNTIVSLVCILQCTPYFSILQYTPYFIMEHMHLVHNQNQGVRMSETETKLIIISSNLMCHNIANKNKHNCFSLLIIEKKCFTHKT